MKMKNVMIAGLGAVLLAAGIIFAMRSFPSGEAKAAAFMMIGLGCGLLGHGLGDILARSARKNQPKAQRQFEIEQQDERNIALNNAAKAKAYDVMVGVFGALMIAFAIMGVDVAPVLLMVAAYLLVIGCKIVFRMGAEKDM